MIVLNNIKSIRRTKGLSQQEMAVKLNITASTYQKIEQNLISLTIERFLEICRILEIDSYNDLLPAVNWEIVERIEKVMYSGSMAFDNIRVNSNSCRRLLDDLKEKVKEGNLKNDAILDELNFIDNYLALIGRDSFNEGFLLASIKDLIEKID